MRRKVAGPRKAHGLCCRGDPNKSQEPKAHTCNRLVCKRTSGQGQTGQPADQYSDGINPARPTMRGGKSCAQTAHELEDTQEEKRCSICTCNSEAFVQDLEWEVVGFELMPCSIKRTKGEPLEHRFPILLVGLAP